MEVGVNLRHPQNIFDMLLNSSDATSKHFLPIKELFPCQRWKQRFYICALSSGAGAAWKFPQGLMKMHHLDEGIIRIRGKESEWKWVPNASNNRLLLGKLGINITTTSSWWNWGISNGNNSVRHCAPSRFVAEIRGMFYCTCFAHINNCILLLTSSKQPQRITRNCIQGFLKSDNQQTDLLENYTPAIFRFANQWRMKLNNLWLKQ